MSGQIPGERININLATRSELESLPGIGPALAGRIVKFRETHGPFSRPEDILIIQGVGEKLYDGIAGLIRVE